MKSASAFYVFGKWKDAGDHAFGSKNRPSQVPQEDKSGYSAIFDELMVAAEAARSNHPAAAQLRLRPMNFSPEYGSRGHRPVDLWVSICGLESMSFGHFPQVYAIASDRGLEVGFAATIDEADYHDPEVKARNRLIVPLLNSKLPSPNSQFAHELDAHLAGQDGWHYNRKTRLLPGDYGFDQSASVSELLASLKATGETSGGGTVCRVFKPDALAAVDLIAEFTQALADFYPLIAMCSPSPWDTQLIVDQDVVAELAAIETVSDFDPANVEDGRKKVLAAVARRLGQAAFRKKLFKAYDGKCAITGTDVPNVLQAAHITPYLGQATNDVTNGLLLRADVHTLFDLRLIRIDPSTLTIQISEVLKGTQYEIHHGQAVTLPATKKLQPSVLALASHFHG